MGREGQQGVPVCVLGVRSCHCAPNTGRQPPPDRSSAPRAAAFTAPNRVVLASRTLPRCLPLSLATPAYPLTQPRLQRPNGWWCSSLALSPAASCRPIEPHATDQLTNHAPPPSPHLCLALLVLWPPLCPRTPFTLFVPATALDRRRLTVSCSGTSSLCG